MPRLALKLRPINGGYEVHRGRNMLGVNRTTRERSGRSAFSLGCDRRKPPRSYRGTRLAVRALVALADVVAGARRKHLSLEEVVLAAWAARPPASAKAGKLND